MYDEQIAYIIKLILFTGCSLYTILKITNETSKIKGKKILSSICIIVISIICGIIKYISNSFNSIVCLILLLVMLLLKITRKNIGNVIIATIISLAINYIIFFISVSISFIPKKIINITNEYTNILTINSIYLLIWYIFIKIPKLKHGFSFLTNDRSNEYLDILIMNLSVIILFCVIIISNYNEIHTSSIGIALIIFSIIMFITIQKSLQLYYKQKLQQKELEETKEELEKAKQEISELEKENLNFSKKSHSIAHKQKALEYKLNQLLLNDEIAEELDIKDKIKEISKQIQNEDTTIELTKTNIEEIDDMLKYMQSECEKNKIDLELQVNGNIHHMVNKFIAKENLEILLADHIKNAIIAINYSENINRSILVKLGLIEGFYSIYIYDTGIEFEIKTLQNLGQVPSTTHADNGGTGMGFMNTFDTLNKYKASIIINEYGKPSKDNYTKYIAIKFDNKNEYKINSYRSKEIEQQGFLGPSLNPGIENV